MVDRRVCKERPCEAAGGREDRAEKEPHDPCPQHPAPARSPPDLMERCEHDRGSHDPDEGHEKTAKKELLSDGPRHRHCEQGAVARSPHRRSQRRMQSPGPAPSADDRGSGGDGDSPHQQAQTHAEKRRCCPACSEPAAADERIGPEGDAYATCHRGDERRCRDDERRRAPLGQRVSNFAIRLEPRVVSPVACGNHKTSRNVSRRAVSCKPRPTRGWRTNEGRGERHRIC
jgi:hypothetical protein